MKRLSAFALICAAALGTAAGEYADAEVNLLRADKIEPAYMHDKITGVRGYMMNDIARNNYTVGHRKYIAGEECLKVDVNKDGEATISYPDPLPAPYAENPGPNVHLYIGIDPQPPAETFRISGRVKLDKGALQLSNGPKFKPAPDWQKFDYQGKPFFILITPAAGAHISFADIKMTPVYPAIGGGIALPDGGRLTRLLLPKNADFVTRWGVAMWRGWLWKLTGVALPIVTVDKVEPAEGAFAATVDPSLKRGWRLAVGKNGITLTCSEEDDIVPALFDYLRMGLDCAFYGPDCAKMPTLPVAELPAIDRLTKPRYRAILQSSHYPLYSGGKIGPARYVRNDVNYYHLNYPDWIHILNTAIPQELYFKDHPEYFMMDASGNRVVAFRPSFTHQCFTNPGARRVMLKGLTDIAKMQKGFHRMCFEPGDTDLFCLCPECVAFSGTKKTNIDLLMDFTNQVARAVREIDPEFKILRCAYLSRCYPPKKVKVEENIHIFDCLTEHALPCTIHVECERNREKLKMLGEWKRALGDDASRLGFMTYDDARPLQYVRMAEYLNQFGSGDFYMFYWHYTPQAINFVLPRWNLGEDADKLMEEFDFHYFGKAGKEMHKITLFIDEYGKNFKHGPGEGRLTALFCGHQQHTRTWLDRAALDQIYSMFDEAIKAAGDDKTVRARIFREKKYVLAEDLIRYGSASCATDAELDAFIRRLVDFITMAREAPQYFGAITPDQDMRSFLLANTGLVIPNTGKFWAKEPYVDKFLADPKSFFSSADRIPGGWYFKPLAMRGAESPVVYGYQCPPRYSVVLRRPADPDGAPQSGYAPAGAALPPDRSKATITMKLDYTPEAPSFLAIEGQDDDKPGTSLMRVTVNGKVVFSGPNRLPELSWGRMGLNIPAGVLKAGDNTIVIANITPNRPPRSGRFTDPDEAAKDPQWGWIVISEACWIDPNHDFRLFLDGSDKTPWVFHDGNSRSSGVHGEGKAELNGGEVGPNYLGAGHNCPKIAITPGARVKVTVTASGSGAVRMGLWDYRPYKGTDGNFFTPGGFCGGHTKLLPRRSTPAFELSAAPKTFSYVLTPPAGTGQILPRIFSDKDTKAVVTDFRMELLPPEK